MPAEDRQILQHLLETPLKEQIQRMAEAKEKLLWFNFDSKLLAAFDLKDPNRRDSLHEATKKYQQAKGELLIELHRHFPDDSEKETVLEAASREVDNRAFAMLVEEATPRALAGSAFQRLCREITSIQDRFELQQRFERAAKVAAVEASGSVNVLLGISWWDRERRSWCNQRENREIKHEAWAEFFPPEEFRHANGKAYSEDANTASRLLRDFWGAVERECESQFPDPVKRLNILGKVFDDLKCAALLSLSQVRRGR